MSVTIKSSYSKIYGIIPDTLLNKKNYLQKLELTLKTGLYALQYRDKRPAPFTQKLIIAKSIQKLCSQYKTTLIINDNIKLAEIINADGVHLGQQDLQQITLKQTRLQLGKNKIIGVTVHDSLNLAQEAYRAGASYVSFGCCFSSTTKPNAPRTALDIITISKKMIKCPVVAIGGITTANAPTVLNAGADILAIGHDIFLTENHLDNLQILNTL